MSHTLVQAYNAGFYGSRKTGIHTNPYNKEQDPDLWTSWQLGSKQGKALFFPEESVEYPNEEKENATQAHP